MRLRDKVTIITGAGSGIGRTSAVLFAREGAKVVVNDLSEEKGMSTVQEIQAEGNKAVFIQADVTVAVQVERMVQQVIESCGQIDVLFNNAGIACIGAIHELDEELWDHVVNVNMKGVFLPCKYVLPHMMSKKTGAIINMSSTTAESGLLRRAVYGATKGGVLALTKAMQVDYASYNIRVNALLPGTIFTPFVENYLNSAYDDPEEALANIKKRQLSGELGKPEDVAYAALYLASDEAKFMMGAPLYIDGGVMAGKMA